MARCQLCYDLEKKDPDDSRLASDFAPKELLDLKNSKRCVTCSFILEGILHFEDGTWTFMKDVSRVYLYALGSEGDTLTLEIYFLSERPKLILEFFVLRGECESLEAISSKVISAGSYLKTNHEKGIHFVRKLFNQGHVSPGTQYCPMVFTGLDLSSKLALKSTSHVLRLLGLRSRKEYSHFEGCRLMRLAYGFVKTKRGEANITR